MSLLIRNWSLLTVSNVIQQGSVFISLIFIARILTPSLYGEFTFIITAVNIAQNIASLGLQKIVIREIARENSKLKIVARRIMIPFVLVNLVTAIGLVFYLNISEGISDSLTIALTVGYLFSFSLWNYTEPLAFGLQNMKPTAILNSVSAVMLLAAVMFLPNGILSFPTILTIFIGTHFLKSFSFLIYEFRSGYFSKTTADHDAVTFKTLFTSSLPVYFTSLLTIPVTQLPVIFLSMNSTKEEVGFLGISMKMALPLSLIANNLFTAVYPILAGFAKRDVHIFKKRVTEILKIFFVASILFTLFLSIMSSEIVNLFLGDKYFTAIKVLSFQAWIALFAILNNLIGIIFLAGDKEKLLIKLSIINSTLIGAANYIGSFEGATILSMYSLIGTIVSCAINWYYLFKTINLSWKPSEHIFLIFSVVLFISSLHLMSEAHIINRIIFLVSISFIFAIIVKKIFNLTFMKIKELFVYAR